MDLSRRAGRELIVLGRLALPIIVTQLSQMGMGVADAIMAGQVSAADLAGVALGGNFFWPTMLFLSGVILSVSPSVSQLDGAGRQHEAGEVVRQALWIALAGGSALLVLMRVGAGPAFRWIGIDPVAVPIATAYLDALSIGLLPVLGYFALRYLCEGMSWTKPAMVIAVTALLVKIPLNYWFIYGGFGLEPMGGVGCGWASAVVMWFEFVAMAVVVTFARRVRHLGALARFSPPDPTRIRELARLGVPIGASMFFEIAVFSFITLMIGRLGVEAVAAHQIATSIGGLAFMIPLALGMAATIRVGFNIGARDRAGARLAAMVALGAAVGVALVAVVLVLTLRVDIAALYTQDPAVRALGAELLLFVALFALFDNTQVAAIGSLRGFKDTRVPMFIALFAYWGVALPVGAAFGFGLMVPALGVYGFWIGLTAGLAVAAIVLCLRLQRVSKP